MSFMFSEQFTVALPDNLVQDHSQIQEAVKEAGTSAGLVVEISAIHAGYTENNTYYSATALAKSIPSWVSPYPKPVIMNHDLHSEPVGRVVGAKMDTEADGKEYIRIQAAITDPEAIQKVLDKRYITGSVGGKAEEALCSICGTDWASRESRSGNPCKHTRGKSYNGVIASLNLGGLSFKEYSFVNAPADSHSFVRTISSTGDNAEAGTSDQTENEDTWVKPSKFFIYSLSDQKIKEYTNSSDTATYALGESDCQFLDGVLALDYENHSSLFVDNESIQNTNENVKSLLLQEFFMENEVVEQDDDVLAVTEKLSADLVAENETSQEEDNTADSVDADVANEADEDQVSDDKADDTEPDVKEDESEDVKDSADEADEDTKEDDASDKDADKAEDDSDKADEAKADEVEDDKVEEDDKEDEPADKDDENGLDTKDSVEPEVASLVQENAALKEENVALRKALHRTLAERVVDTKISLGIEELDARASLIEEHSERSASSLADSLRDLAKLPPAQRQVIAAENLNLNMESTTVNDGDEPSFTEGEDVQEKTEQKPADVFVDKFVSILSGKSNLH